MPGKTSEERLRLEAITNAMIPVFEAAGAEFIDPDIIQPADVFLERSGEHIRARTYVFTGPSGEELCLRPDLTVPACRLHLERQADPAAAKRYCYAGKAFRHAPDTGGSEQAMRELHQIGLEVFGRQDVAATDSEVLELTLQALQAADVADFHIELGDLGLFTALLQSIDMPARWRSRLRRQFWRPRAFRELLGELSGARERQRSSISGLLDELSGSGLDATAFVERQLDGAGLQMVAGRSVEQVAHRLAEKLEDRAEPRLSQQTVTLVDAYLSVRGTPCEAAGKLEELAARTGPEFGEAVALFRSRLTAMETAGLPVAQMTFAAVFGRSLEYYTGFVFQIEQRTADGAANAIAGGGRYDTMLKDIGAPDDIPAVGCAIQADRLAGGAGARP